MRKDVLQCVFQENHIRSKQEQTIEFTCEMNRPGISLNYLDISPPVFSMRLLALILITGLISTPTT
jgi:hypothetical protein